MDLNLWPYPPNWARRVEEELSFRTEIIESKDGSEQRIAQRVHPRVRHKWSSVLSQSRLSRALSRVAQQQGRAFEFAHPRFPATLAASAAAGASTVVLETPRPFWVVSGQRMIFYDAAQEDGEAVTILSVIGGTVTFTPALLNSYPAGAAVRQAIYGRFAGGVEISAETTRTATCEIEIVQSPNPGHNFVRSYAVAASTFAGEELFTKGPNWITRVSHTFEQPRTAHDFQRGAVEYTLDHDTTSRQFTANFLVKDATTLDAIMGLFYRARGRQKAFYVPSWLNELQPVWPVPSPTNYITFAGPELYHLFYADATHRALFFRTTGGDFYRSVADANLDPSGNSVLEVTAPVSGLAQAATYFVSWLLRARFANDRLALDWITHDAARVALTFRSLSELPA